MSKDKRQPFVRFAKDKQGKWFWRMQAANNRVVAVGTTSHDTFARAKAEVHKAACTRGMYEWSVYQDNRKQWRWRMQHRRSNDIIAGSYEGFSSHAACAGACQVPYGILVAWEAGGVRVVVAD